MLRRKISGPTFQMGWGGVGGGRDTVTGLVTTKGLSDVFISLLEVKTL